MADWREQIRKDPRLKRVKRQLQIRKRLLEQDKIYVVETERLTRALEKAYKQNPKAVRLFFCQFSHPTPFQLPRIQEFIDGQKSKNLQRALKKYISYVARFSVVMILEKKKLHFRPIILPQGGSKFHVKLVSGHFEPVRPVSEESAFSDFFESESVVVSDQLRKLIESGSAKFFRIDDACGSSVLSELESVAYYPEGITFVLHKAEQPYLFCLVGEKVSDHTWRRASKAVKAFQREYFERGKAGRPPNLKELKKGFALDRSPGPLKEKAASLGPGETEKDLRRKQVQLSRIRKRLR